MLRKFELSLTSHLCSTSSFYVSFVNWHFQTYYQKIGLTIMSDMSDLYYITYVSKIGLKALLTPSTLYDIETVAKKRNIEANITGFFCYGNQYFFQYIEGNYEDIEQLCQRLRQDSRHHNMQILNQGSREQRLFGKWDMYAVTFDEFITQYSSAHLYIPFVPYIWQKEDTQDFVMMFYQYYLNNDDKNKKTVHIADPIIYNRLGMSLNDVLGQHQSFMFTKLMVLLVVLMLGVFMVNLLGYSSYFSL